MKRTVKFAMGFLSLFGLWLGGCGDSKTTAAIPTQSQPVQGTIEASPSGDFNCGFPLGTALYGRPRGLSLEPDGRFRFFRHEAPGQDEQGGWSYAAQLHQIGFDGGTSLDYAYYDIGANQLIIYLKPNADGQAAIVHCVRANTDFSLDQ